MNTTSNSDCCGGCGETDGNKRRIGCMHPFTTASAPEASKIAPGDDMWLSIHMAPFHLNYLTGDDRKEVLAYGRSVYQATRHVNDSLTDRKTNEIMEERGYQLTGYVLRHPETQHRAIIESSAVRWVQAADMAAIMYPQNRQAREALTDERIFRVIGTMPKDGYTLATFARAIEAEINKATT